jgi:mRNA interferase MazF
MIVLLLYKNNSTAQVITYGPSGLVMVLPITAQTKLLKGQIIISPPEDGLTKDSAIKCEQIRTIDKEKRLIEKMGQVTTNTMSRVEGAVKIFLGF